MEKPIYFYRKRHDESSAIQTSWQNKSFYTTTPLQVYQHLFNRSKELNQGKVLQFIQFSVMYDLQWRIKAKRPNVLTDHELQTYRNVVTGLLQDIDDNVILRQRHLWKEYKLYALSLKYGIDFAQAQKLISVSKNQRGVDFTSPISKRITGFHYLDKEANGVIDFIHYEQKSNSIIYEGTLNTLFPREKLCVWAEDTDKKRYFAQLTPHPSKNATSAFEKEFFTKIGFRIVAPICDMWFYIQIENKTLPLTLRGGNFSPVDFTWRSYGFVGNYIITTPGKQRVRFQKKTPLLVLKRELLYQKWLHKHRPHAKKIYFIRFFAVIKKYILKDILPSKKEKIILLSDRPNMAGDNAEALFFYLQKHPIKGIKPIFVLHKDSPDYARIKHIGPVVSYLSKKHLWLHLHADAIVSSAFDLFVISPFVGVRNEIRNIYNNTPYIFLQHGITDQDMSALLGRHQKNISFFCTAAHNEYTSILDTKAYDYAKHQVKLTGFSRHDKLLEQNTKPHKILLIMPTWREYLAGAIDYKTGTRVENKLFEHSGYYIFWQTLINDSRLKKYVKQGWKVRFLLHPAFKQEAHKFSSPFATIVTNYNYAQELTHASIALTDYSSVVFDFALLKRPIIYAQTDKERFLATSPRKQSYFNDTADGFGPVTTSYEETIQALTRYMSNPCMENKYKKRVQNFFYWPKQDGTPWPRSKSIAEEIASILNISQ